MLVAAANHCCIKPRIMEGQQHREIPTLEFYLARVKVPSQSWVAMTMAETRSLTFLR